MGQKPRICSILSLLNKVNLGMFGLNCSIINSKHICGDHPRLIKIIDLNESTIFDLERFVSNLMLGKWRVLWRSYRITLHSHRVIGNFTCV